MVDETAERQMCLGSRSSASYNSHFKHSGSNLMGTGLHTWFGAVLYFLGPSTHLSPYLGVSSLPSPLAS